MLSVVSAGAAAGVGGMDRLRSRGATARDLASSRDRREVRVHAVHTDIAINFPPSIALPDGEDHPFNSRLQLRNAEQVKQREKINKKQKIKNFFFQKLKTLTIAELIINLYIPQV